MNSVQQTALIQTALIGTILIIEDNPMNLELATEVLERSGHKVISANNAEEGIVLARSEALVLILMDIALPGMSGFDAIQLLNQDEKTCGIPVVVLSAHARSEDRKQALDSGCRGYISKPIDVTTFHGTLCKLLSDVSSVPPSNHIPPSKGA